MRWPTPAALVTTTLIVVLSVALVGVGIFIGQRMTLTAATSPTPDPNVTCIAPAYTIHDTEGHPLCYLARRMQ